MRATDILRQQHEEILALFRRLTATNGRADRDETLAEIIAKLDLHTRLEERYFYPAIESLESKKAQEEILESYDEHRIVDFLLSQLPAMDSRHERFEARCRVLHSLLQEHIEEEEDEIFKLAARLREGELERLGEAMTSEIEEVQHVGALLDRAARAARRVERFTSRLVSGLVASVVRLPIRALEMLVPSRLQRMANRDAWANEIAAHVPRLVVDSLYGMVVRNGSGREREREEGRFAAVA